MRLDNLPKTAELKAKKRVGRGPARGFMVLDVINENVEKIEVLCQQYERDMPSEFKLIYDTKSGKFQADYKYDLIYTHDDLKTL